MDLLVTDPVTGRSTGFAKTVRRALRSMEACGAPYCVVVPVATLEHLLLLYSYSNQPKHLGDFAAIVVSGRADLGAAERKLAAFHPEMIGEWAKRVRGAQQPPPSPRRPPPRKRRD